MPDSAHRGPTSPSIGGRSPADWPPEDAAQMLRRCGHHALQGRRDKGIWPATGFHALISGFPPSAWQGVDAGVDVGVDAPAAPGTAGSTPRDVDPSGAARSNEPCRRAGHDSEHRDPKDLR
jgi:hypothetical protein